MRMEEKISYGEGLFSIERMLSQRWDDYIYKRVGNRSPIIDTFACLDRRNTVCAVSKTEWKRNS